MTPYNLLRLRCGLSQPEAAMLHGVRLDTVKSWCSGRNRPPPSVLPGLRTLYACIEHAAAEAITLIVDAPGAEIELAYARDLSEAQSLGWPCVGAQAAMLGLVVAMIDRPVRLVPRGSTAATAAAAEAHHSK